MGLLTLNSPSKAHTMKNLPAIWLALLVMAGFISCFPDKFEVAEPEEWNPAFGIPIINTSFGINDLLEGIDDDGLIVTDMANRLTIVYQDRVTINPDFEIDPLPTIPVPISQKEQTVEYEDSDEYRLEIIRLKEGQFQYTVQNPFMEAVSFTLTFTNLRLDGSSLSVSAMLPPADMNGASETVGTVDLTGYELNLEDDIQTTYTASLIGDNSPVDLPPFLTTITGMQYNYMQGYFGKFDVDLFSGDSLEFGFLDSWESGELEFLEPVISLTFYNTMGVPMSLRSDRFDLYTFRNGIVPLENPMLNDGVPFAFPSINEVGEAKTTLIQFNADNSNIVSALSGVPYQMDYAFSAVANPDENPLITNHLTDDLSVEIDLEVDIPLYARAKGFRIVDTFEVDLTDLDDFERLGFKLVADNGFPIELGMQLQFLDGNGMVLDSLFQDGPRLVESGNLRPDGSVSTSKESILESELSGSQLEQILKQTANARVVAILETPDEGAEPARMLDTYTLGLRLGILAGL